MNTAFLVCRLTILFLPSGCSSDTISSHASMSPSPDPGDTPSTTSVRWSSGISRRATLTLVVLPPPDADTMAVMVLIDASPPTIGGSLTLGGMTQTTRASTAASTASAQQARACAAWRMCWSDGREFQNASGRLNAVGSPTTGGSAPSMSPNGVLASRERFQAAMMPVESATARAAAWRSPECS